MELLARLIQGDSILTELYQEYFEEKKPPTRDEVFAMVRFMSTFSIGCSRLGLLEHTNRWGERLETYIIMLRKLGYKDGRYWGGRREQGLSTILERATQVSLGY